MKDVLITQEKYESMLKKILAFEIIQDYHLSGKYMDKDLLTVLLGKPMKEDEDF